MRNDPALLSLMLDDQASADDLYRPGPYWSGYQKRISAIIRKEGIENFRGDMRIGKGFADTLSTRPLDGVDLNAFANGVIQLLPRLPGLNKVFGLYDHYLNAMTYRFLKFKSLFYEAKFGNWLAELEAVAPLPDTLVGGPKDVVRIGEKDYAALYLNFLMRLENFRAAGVDFAHMRSVMEIGGGFGAMMHLMLSRFSGIRKIMYVDIPPMSYVGTQYLRHFYGDAVIDYAATRNRDRISFAKDDRLEIFVLCPWQVPRIADCSIDLLYNSASFSEMPPDIVKNYAAQIAPLLHPQHGRICLVINKEEAHIEYDYSLPDQILSAFEPPFRFDRIEPRWELPVPMRYYVGYRDAERPGQGQS